MLNVSWNIFEKPSSSLPWFTCFTLKLIVSFSYYSCIFSSKQISKKDHGSMAYWIKFCTIADWLWAKSDPKAPHCSGLIPENCILSWLLQCVNVFTQILYLWWFMSFKFWVGVLPMKTHPHIYRTASNHP